MDRLIELTKFSSKEIRLFLDSFDTVLLDCDDVPVMDHVPVMDRAVKEVQRVIWYAYEAIKDVPETLKWLKQNGKRVIFVSNNSTLKMQSYRAVFNAMGLDVSDEDIIYPSKVIIWYLKNMEFKDEAYVIGSTSFRELLTAEGIKLCEPTPNVVEEDQSVVMKLLYEKLPVKAVILDFDVNLNWIKLNVARELLRKDDLLLIIGGLDKFISLSSKPSLLGQEQFYNILLDEVDKKPILCGKPSENLKEYIFAKFNITKPDRCIFIGDSLQTDMKFASMCNFKSLFVGSGVNNLEEVGVITKTIPNYYLPSLGHLLPHLEKIESETWDKCYY